MGGLGTLWSNRLRVFKKKMTNSQENAWDEVFFLMKLQAFSAIVIKKGRHRKQKKI